MILLDTQIWIWWVDGSQQLTDNQKQTLEKNLDIPLLTADSKILNYPYVKTL